MTASDGAANDLLGSSVALSQDGSSALGGAYGASSSQGAAYVFVKPGGGWANATQTAKLTASDGAGSDLFGFSLALSSDGGTALIGAYFDDVGANVNQGSAYVFVKPGGGWANATQTAKLTASDGAASDRLGWAVALAADGGTALGAATSHNSGLGAGYVFVKPGGGWANATQTAKLTASDGAASDQFGWAVALAADGGTALIGAYSDDVGANADQGSAHVFVKPGGGWADATQTAKLTASDGAASDRFGEAVVLSGGATYALVGALLDDVGANLNQGSAYVFLDASNDATLSAISLSVGSLSPAFAAGTTSYTMSTSASSITVNPSRSHASATIRVRVNGGTWETVSSPSSALALNVGSNTVEVEVTAQDGSTTITYTITVTRLSTDATLSALSLSSGLLNESFAAGTRSYTASVASGMSSITVDPSRSHASATIRVRVNAGSWQVVSSPSGALALNVGSNTVEVEVTAQDGATVVTYTITVTRAAPAAAAVPEVERAGYCLNGVFLNLEKGQPDTDPKYKGATVAVLTPGVGYVCSVAASVTPVTPLTPVTSAPVVSGAAGAAARPTVSGVTTREASVAKGAKQATRYWVAVETSGSELRLSFDGGRTAERWVDALPVISIGTKRDEVWIQVRDGDGGTSTWAHVSLEVSPASVSTAPVKSAESGADLLLAAVPTRELTTVKGGTATTRYWISLATNGSQVRFSFDGGATARNWVSARPTLTVYTRMAECWIQTRAADGHASGWIRIPLAAPTS